MMIIIPVIIRTENKIAAPNLRTRRIGTFTMIRATKMKSNPMTKVRILLSMG
jgi:hypothetical protein